VNSINDNWKYALAKVSGGRVDLLPYDSVTQNALGSTLSEIARSYSDFKKAFSMVDNNYLKVPIYCNDSFGYDRGNGTKLDEIFFGVTGPGEHRDRLLSISWSDLTEEGLLRSKPDVEGILHLILSPEKYNALKGAYRSAVRRYHVADGKSRTLLEHINSFRKGSKHFRKVICQTSFREKLSSSRQCKTFLRLIDCELPDTLRLSNLYTGWNFGFYPANVRVFLFKYYNNILGINSRVSHFNPLINGSCTFCGINGPYPPNNETFVHIFFECPYVNDIILYMASRYLRNFTLSQRSFFITDCCEYERDNKLFNNLLGRSTIYHLAI
jgi:hypothetical protein